MCGICGITSLDGRPLDTPDRVIRKMAGMLTHRGPDQEGFHLDPSTHLGARRLSIQDVEGGSQPISNEDGSVVVVFNGEIYNFKELRDGLLRRGHVLKTRCDTEVIVHLYEELGEDCVGELNGQFAFALWDRRKGRLLLARDRLGHTPLFYTVVDGVLIFASEIKSILVHPSVDRSVDYKCLDQTFTFFMPVNPRTMFKGISNLPPGRLIDVRGGEVRVRKYWEPHFPDIRRAPRVADETLIEEFREELEKAVRYRMIADVPLAVFLSGGLDSTVIAHLASRLSGQRISTFSIVHEDGYYDESQYSDLMARELGSDHHRLAIRPKDIADFLPAMIWNVEAPSCKTSHAAYMRLYRMVREAGFKVVLTGEGADEALGGYPNIRMMKVLEYARRNPEADSSRLMEEVLPAGSTLRVMYHAPRVLSRRDEAEVFGRFGCIPVDLQRFRSLAEIKRSLYSDACLEALDGYSAEAEVGETLVNKDLVAGRHYMQQAQYFEYLLKLPNYLLINPGDRAAMSQSVENRCPFLDHNLIDFCTALPARMRVRRLEEKSIMKQAFRDQIPAEILRRKKKPFTTVFLSSLFRDGHANRVAEVLTDAAVERAGLFRVSAVREMKQRLLDPGLTLEDQVKLETPFALVVTAQLWHDLFIENFRPEGPPAP